jgi:hypothetical protein
MVSVMKLTCQEHQPLTMVSSMKLSPQDHRALETGLITSHRTRLGPKNIHKVGPDWGIKGHESGRCSSQPQDMYKAALKSGIRWWWYWIWWQGKFVDSRMITLLFSLYGLPTTSMCLGQDHIFIRLGLLHCPVILLAPTWELLVGNQCDNTRSLYMIAT